MVCRFGKVWGNSKNGVTESRYGNSLVAREFKEVGRRGGSKELPEVQNRADSQSLGDDVLSGLATFGPAAVHRRGQTLGRCCYIMAEHIFFMLHLVLYRV